MNKVRTLEEAWDKFRDGQTIMFGGFLAVGTPETLVDGLVKKGVKDLTVIGNDTSYVDRGIGRLIASRQIKKAIVSHIGTNKETGRQMTAGELDVELVPQGTLAERIRAAGAGLGGFLTPTGVGTIVEEGKQKLTINGKEYLLEMPLKADIAILKAWKADKSGNLVYRRATRNFNPLMALAADFVIAEVEQIVEIGELNPDEVVTPGTLVDMIVKA
jgi:acetate CoA/acetoacetate CoA-transferase alpha subunit